MLISEKTTEFVWLIYLFHFVLFDFWFLFIYFLFIFLRQKKGIHEGDT